MMKRLTTALFFLALILVAGRAAAQTAPTITIGSYPDHLSIYEPVVLTATITDTDPGELPSAFDIHGTITVTGLLSINLDDPLIRPYFPSGFPVFYDDGAHSDGDAGDGVYGFELDIMTLAASLAPYLGADPEDIPELVDLLLSMFPEIPIEVGLVVWDNNTNSLIASLPAVVNTTFYDPSPTISNLVYPQVMSLNDTVTISMLITDPDDNLPACVQLYGTFSSPDFPLLGPIEFDAEGLHIFVCDDGGPGDDLGDGIYTVQVDLGAAIGAGNIPPEYLPLLTTDFFLDADFWVLDFEGNKSNTVSGQAVVGGGDQLGPHISDLDFPAEVLTTDTDVTVSMLITDEQGDIPLVIQAWASVSSPTFPNVSPVLVDIILYDDGTHGDVDDDDGIYTRTADLAAAIAAFLPPGFEAYMTDGTVTAKVHVVDEAGHWSNEVTASAHYNNPTVHRPVISEFTYPSFVLASDTITATAKITDEDFDITHGCIQIHASGSSPTFPNLGTITTAMFPTIDIDMCDDGRQGDVTPNDGFYTITEKLSDHLGSVPDDYKAFLTDFLANGEWWVFDDHGHQSNVVTGSVHFYNPAAARPVISAVTFPASISTNDMVLITATVSDANGDLDPCLRVNGTISSPAFPEYEINYEDFETYICDNGTQGDAIAGDGIYTYQEDMAVVLTFVDPDLIDLIGDGGPLYAEMWVFDQAEHQSNVVSAFSEIHNADPDAPVISNFIFPASAGPTGTVTVSAHIDDANSFDLPDCVIVHGTAFSPTYPNIGVVNLDAFAAQVTISLCDDGSMGDATDGDGTYTHVVNMADALAALPAAFRPLATDAYVTVSWWVRDDASHQSNTVIGTTHYSDPASHRPVITNAVFPTFATTDDSVILSAHITDSLGDIPKESIPVHATATSSTFPNLGTIPFTFTLFDNGTNGDLVAGDGTYTQRIDIWRDVVPFIPAFLEPYATDIEFTAIGWVFDTAGNQSNVVSGTGRFVDPDAHRPVVTEFSFPGSVEADDVVRITARISDAAHDLAPCLRMHGLVTSPTFPEVGVLKLDDYYPLVEVELCDDGLLGDNLAGDGIYTVQRSISEIMPLVPAPFRQYLTEFDVSIQWWVFDNAGNQSNVSSGSSHFYNSAPVIVSFNFPTEAGPDDTIFITAKIVDADGDLPAQIQMLGTVTSPTWPELGVVNLSTFIPIMLYDDATNGDVKAGDGIYSRRQDIAETLDYLPSGLLPYVSDGVVIDGAFFVKDLALHSSNVWSASATYVDPLNHAPVLSDPVFPTSADSDDVFMLSVRITDEDGDLPPDSITVHVIATAPGTLGFGEVLGTFTLYDNGTMGDVAHDGVYSQRIYAATDLMPNIPVALLPMVSDITITAEGWVFDLNGHKSNTLTGTTHFVNLDNDGDGVPNATELASLCMNPNNPDTDGDGLCDGNVSVAGCIVGEDMDLDGEVDGGTGISGESDPCSDQHPRLTNFKSWVWNEINHTYQVSNVMQSGDTAMITVDMTDITLPNGPHKGDVHHDVLTNTAALFQGGIITFNNLPLPPITFEQLLTVYNTRVWFDDDGGQHRVGSIDLVENDGTYTKGGFLDASLLTMIPEVFLQFGTNVNYTVTMWTWDEAGNRSNNVTLSGQVINHTPVIYGLTVPAGTVGPDDTVAITFHGIDYDGDLGDGDSCVPVHAIISTDNYPGEINLDTYNIPIIACDGGVNGDLIGGDGIYSLDGNLAAVIAAYLPEAFLPYISDFTVTLVQMWVEDNAHNLSNILGGQSVHFFNPYPVVYDVHLPTAINATDTINVSMEIFDADGFVPADGGIGWPCIDLYGCLTATLALGDTVSVCSGDPEAASLFPMLCDNGDPTNWGDSVSGDGRYSNSIDLWANLGANLPPDLFDYLADATFAFKFWVFDNENRKSNVAVASSTFVYECADNDGDFYGTGCVLGLDCDDNDENIYPGAPDTIADGIDQNCDGAETCFVDADKDTYRLATTVESTLDTLCSTVDGEALASASIDCDDANPAINQLTFYLDLDGDSYGNPDPLLTTLACSVPAGYSANSDDCNDGNAAVKPGATEICDGVDNNCVAGIDEGLRKNYYADFDFDTFGGAPLGNLCSQPLGSVIISGDCNDNASLIYPGAPEQAGDQIDQNCDGRELCYVDADKDTFRTAFTVASPDLICATVDGEALAAAGVDCNDGDFAIKPGVAEVCDDYTDNNCDGKIDEGCPGDTDSDFDGLTDTEEAFYGTLPLDPDTDNDGLLDGPEVFLYNTDPLLWDTDGDGLPDMFEVDNMTGHPAGQNLDPRNLDLVDDGALDFDGDGNSNVNEYWNGSDLWTINPTGGEGCYFWGEGNGDNFIGALDTTMLAQRIKSTSDYSNVIPNTGETQDLDDNGFWGGLDLTLLTAFIKGQSTAGIYSRPASIEKLSPATVTVQAGNTTHVTVALRNSNPSFPPGFGYTPGFGVVFTIDPTSTGTAVILGGDGADPDSNRYDVTEGFALLGRSNVVILVKTAGTIKINAGVPQCGLFVDKGRYCSALTMAVPFVINGP